LALNDTMLNFDTKNSTQQLTYNLTAAGASTTTFGASWVKTGPDYINNYLTVGDIVRLNFTSTSPISQSQTVKMKLIPKRGVIVPIEFVTPDVISTMRVSLYP
jgi:archaellin